VEAPSVVVSGRAFDGVRQSRSGRARRRIAWGRVAARSARHCSRPRRASNPRITD